MTPEEYFDGHQDSARLFEVVKRAIAAIGPAEICASKSQIAFRRRVNFAFVWIPALYLERGAPLVLTVGLRRRSHSPRWKQVVEPSPGHFTHHLELREPDDVDAEVRGWLREAWEQAG